MVAAFVALMVALLVPLGRARIPVEAAGGQGDRLVSMVAGAIGLGVGLAALIGMLPGTSPAVGAMATVSCLIVAAMPPPRQLSTQGQASVGLGVLAPMIGMGIGPALAAVALAALGVAQSATANLLASQGQLVLIFGAGVLMAFALGFVARALVRLGMADQGEPGPALSAPLVLTALLALLAFRTLTALGGSATVAHLPVMDSVGEAVVLLLDFDLGIPATTAVPELGGLLIAAAAVALVGSVLPSPAMRAMAGFGGAGLLLGAVVWLATLQGQAMEIDLEMARAALARVGAAEPLIQSPRIQGDAPMQVGAVLTPGTWVLLCTGAAVALGEALALWTAPPHAEPVVHRDQAARLGARDALQVATVSAWLGVVVMLVYGAQVVGVWGPARPEEHTYVAVAMGLTSLVFLLHGAAAHEGAPMRVLRALALSGAAALLAGAAAGGLVGASGVFGL